MKTMSISEVEESLNVSRDWVIQLLREGRLHLPFDVEQIEAYKQERDRRRAEALQEMARISEEAGLYDG